MVSASVINTLLLKIQRQAEAVAAGDPIEITTTMLESSNISSHAFTAALRFMSATPHYNCLKVNMLSQMGRADDGFETVNVLCQVWLLPNFDNVARGFTRYYKYKTQNSLAISIYPSEDWDRLRTLFENPEINWGNTTNIPSALEYEVEEGDNKASLAMIGNDIVVKIKGKTVVIKKLRNDQAPVYFMRYMLQNPDRFIDTAQIQDEVSMCSQKKDMTELVRQCGFNKNIKRYFFNGTTKDKVRLVAAAKLPSEIVAQILS